jgi:restriction system protein
MISGAVSAFSGDGSLKFKMAPNSLFAVLLRSHWWISFAIAAALAALCFALLPPQYALFGALGALPFVVIGCVRFSRQLGLPNEAEVHKILQGAAGMNQQAFADALREAFDRKGYVAQRVDGDPAVDMAMTKAGQTTLVAFRRWKAANHGVEPLRALVEARARRDATHCVYVTLTEAPQKTQAFAAAHGVELLAGTALAQTLGRRFTAR